MPADVIMMSAVLQWQCRSVTHLSSRPPPRTCTSSPAAAAPCAAQACWGGWAGGWGAAPRPAPRRPSWRRPRRPAPSWCEPPRPSPRPPASDHPPQPLGLENRKDGCINLVKVLILIFSQFTPNQNSNVKTQTLLWTSQSLCSISILNECKSCSKVSTKYSC